MRRGAPRILGESPALRQAVQAMQRAAAADVTVLLEGESGTGKELFARALHAWSRARATDRSSPSTAPPCPRRCSRAELFGYEKGAFTGAEARKPAASSWRTAARSSSTRSASCRRRSRPRSCACSRRTSSSASAAPSPFRPTCASSPRPTATCARRWPNAASARTCSSGSRSFPVTVPPLRERGERRAAARAALPANATPSTAAAACRRSTTRPSPRLTAYTWPGNVRELQNCLERAALLLDGEVISPATCTCDALGPARAGAGGGAGTARPDRHAGRRPGSRGSTPRRARKIAAALPAANDPRRTADALRTRIQGSS